MKPPQQESQKTLKAHSNKLEKKVSELTAKLQDKDAAHLTDIENIRLQLNKQERLTQLYSNNCEEYQVKLRNLGAESYNLRVSQHSTPF